MANTERTKGRDYRLESDEDDTLREVGEDHDFELDDDVDPDPAERRHDPLRQPH